MAASTQGQPIVRQIYFYQLSDVLDLWRSSSLPKFTPSLLASDLAALRDDELFLHTNDEYELCLLSDGGGAFQFGKARTSDTARVLQNRTVKPLRLAIGEKLFECIHMVFFPSGLVGAEFNLIGPKMSSLSEYLDHKLTSCTPVAFDRLVHGDILERLNRVREIKLIEMRIDTAHGDILAPYGDGWIETAKWMKKQLGVGTIEIVLRAGPTAHRSLPVAAISAVRDMLSGSHLRESADKFKIRALLDGSNLPMTIDLLDDKLMASVEIPRDVYRHPDRHKEFMYDKIRQTYAALKQDIMQAVRTVPCSV